MIRIWFSGLLFINFSFATAQPAGPSLQQLLEAGIQHFDTGDYQMAEENFNRALAMDKNNAYALFELAYTLEATERYDEAAKLAKRGLKQKKLADKVRAQFHVLYGNSLDKGGNLNKALKCYERGIEEYPDYYLLHFNAGVAYLGAGELEKAKRHFIQAARLNPEHGSSHYYLSLVCKNLEERIPAILAGARSLYLEPDGPRAELMRTVLSNLVRGNIRDDEAGISFNLNNNFMPLELLLDLSSIQQQVETTDLTVNSPAFLVNFTLLCEGLNSYKTSYGFFWEYYAPYYYGLHSNSLIEGFVRLLADPNFEKVREWKVTNATEIKSLRVYTEGFSFPTKH